MQHTLLMTIKQYKIENITHHFKEINVMDLNTGLKAIGAGLAILAAFGPGIGIGLMVQGAMQGIGRNPDAAGIIQTNMILGIVFTEAVAIYALVVSLVIIFVL
jgi:F-type H+-transporting ATPase subunit c